MPPAATTGTEGNASMTAGSPQARKPLGWRVIPKEHDDWYLLHDAYLDVFRSAEPCNDIDPEARGVYCFDVSDRRLEHLGRQCRRRQHSHPARLAHRPHQGRRSYERHARVDERNL